MDGFLAGQKQKLIYFNMPKSGCTSIKNWLYKIEYGEDFFDPLEIHKNAHHVFLSSVWAPDSLRERFYDSFVFTFVRHPIPRIFSTYHEKIRHKTKYHFPATRRILESQYGCDFSGHASLQRERENVFAFLRCVQDSLRTGKPAPRNPHWAIQVNRIRKAEKTRKLDFIGRVETLQNDLEMIAGRHDLPRVSLPPMNVGPAKLFEYDELLDDRNLNLAREIFAPDMHALGYQ